MTDISELTEMIRALSPELQQDVEEYVRSLHQREHSKAVERQFRLDWRGALREAEGDISSVDLQHQIWKDHEK